MADLVECHSGYAYAERPVALAWQGQRLAVAAVLERRRTPEGVSFRVRTSDEQVFELHYDELHDQWSIIA